MSILSTLSKLEESTIYKLSLEGKILGLRVKYYSMETDSFCYYDFDISYVKRQDLRDYLNKYSKEFKTLDLVIYNGLVCTQDEIDGKISVQEFKDEVSVGTILESVIRVIKEREGDKDV